MNSYFTVITYKYSRNTKKKHFIATKMLIVLNCKRNSNTLQWACFKNKSQKLEHLATSTSQLLNGDFFFYCFSFFEHLYTAAKINFS